MKHKMTASLSKMSEIDRDREIAAKATQGEWLSYEHEQDEWWWAPIAIDVKDGTILVSPQCSEDADHIVRLHNRQPLYDALVDALARCEKRLPDEIVEAYHALEREEP